MAVKKEGADPYLESSEAIAMVNIKYLHALIGACELREANIHDVISSRCGDSANPMTMDEFEMFSDAREAASKATERARRAYNSAQRAKDLDDLIRSADTSE